MAGYLVKSSGKNLVFDLGWGALENLLKAGVNYYDVDAIFLSHMHPDHCSDMLSFLHIALTENESTNRMNRDVTVYGPKGMNKTMEQVLLAFGIGKRKPKYNVFFREIKDGETVKLDNIIIRCFRASHTTTEALAYRIEAERKVLAYSGDTADCVGLRNACRGADVAVLEASWPREMNTTGHMTGEEAGKAAKESFARKLVLTHIAPYYLQNCDVIGDASRLYSGPIFIAEDLMKIRI
jgi:ribonuclease BN (tRNA processing enzyme)